MTSAMDPSPMILVVAEDLLTALLIDRLIAQGYRVSAPDPAWSTQHPAGPLPIDLILAEVRYPYDACLTVIDRWRSRASQPDTPLVLIGPAPSGLDQQLHGRVTWLEGGAPLDVILTAVARWTLQHPIGPAAAPGPRRTLDVGERRR